jgi:hypothetical protein
VVVWSLPFNAGANRNPEVWSRGRVHNATLFCSLDLTSGTEFGTDYIREDLIWKLVSILAGKQTVTRDRKHYVLPHSSLAFLSFDIQNKKRHYSKAASLWWWYWTINEFATDILPSPSCVRFCLLIVIWSTRNLALALLKSNLQHTQTPVLMLLPHSSTVHLATLFLGRSDHHNNVQAWGQLLLLSALAITGRV